jgi:hypothetical protein
MVVNPVDYRCFTIFFLKTFAKFVVDQTDSQEAERATWFFGG